jgi:hypothetical protein
MGNAPSPSFTIPVAVVAAIAAFACLATMVVSYVVFEMPLFLLAFLLMPVPAALLMGVMLHAPILRALAILHTDAVAALYAVVVLFAAEEGADSILWLSAGLVAPLCLLHYLQTGAAYAEFLPTVVPAALEHDEESVTSTCSTEIFRDPTAPNR